MIKDPKTKPKYEVGKKFGKLTILREGKPIRRTVMDRTAVCRCECGNEVTVIVRDLSTGHRTNCGCTRVIDEKMKCEKGHFYDSIDPNGARRCSICYNESVKLSMRRRRAKLKEQGLSSRGTPLVVKEEETKWTS